MRGSPTLRDISLAPRPLKRPNRQLTALAEDVAELADLMLPADGGMFMGVCADLEERVRILWWDTDFTVVAEMSATPADFAEEDSTEGALQRSALALIAYLAGRWPNHAIPPALGVLTDGLGVAFSPDHPSPLDPDWLTRHASGRAELIAILPFELTSSCAILATPVGSGTRH